MDPSADTTTEDPRELHRRAVASFHEFETSFRKRHRLIWLFSLLGPPVLTAILLILIGLVRGPAVAQQYISNALATFFIFGRFVILMGGQHGETGGQVWDFLSSRQLFVMLTYMDIMCALFVAVNVGVLFKVPVVGPRIEELVSDGHFLLRRQPWVRRVAFWGLVLFVVFPSSTTGSIGGSIFGRLLGLSRGRVVTAIAIGSVVGNGIMYLFSDFLNQYIDKDDPLPKIIGVVIIIAVIAVLHYRYRRMKKLYMDRAAKKQEEGPAA
jgi:uncharacterized membrane protein